MQRGLLFVSGIRSFAIIAAFGLAWHAMAEDASEAFEFLAIDDFAQLSTFENVDAFEAEIERYTQACLDTHAGGSAGKACATGSGLWDRELNSAYKRLWEALDPDGQEKLRTSQRKWIESRDSTIEMSTYVLDRHYDAAGSMWHAPRAIDADSAIAEMTKARTLLISRWRKRVTEPVSSDF